MDSHCSTTQSTSRCCWQSWGSSDPLARPSIPGGTPVGVCTRTPQSRMQSVRSSRPGSAATTSPPSVAAAGGRRHEDRDSSRRGLLPDDAGVGRRRTGRGMGLATTYPPGSTPAWRPETVPPVHGRRQILGARPRSPVHGRSAALSALRRCRLPGSVRQAHCGVCRARSRRSERGLPAL